MRSHRAFPPGRGNLKIPTSSRRAARAGLSLYAPCRPKGRVTRWVAWRMVDLFGPRAVPGSPVEWVPPMGVGVWRDLVSEWTEFLGPFDEVAVHQRIQVSRRGFAALLLADGHPVGFVKVRDGDDAPLLNEFRALTSISSAEPRSFAVPRPISVAGVEGWNYLLTTALRPDLHRMPSEPPLREITAEIRAGLVDLPRAPGTPEHWEPMHGDFTPWNLRQRRDGTLILVDWEDAAWAPPGADEVYYRATAEVLGGGDRGYEGSVTATSFWQQRLTERNARTGEASDSDASFGEALLIALEVKNRFPPPPP